MSWLRGGRAAFLDRADAGRQLAAHLHHVRSEDPVVVGLPRGGVVVAAEVAAALDAPLDVIVVRKLGVPGEAEWAMGAIGEDGVRVVDERVLAAAGVSDHEVEGVEARERVELARRAQRYRAGRSRIPLRDRTVVVVDDGVATGATARAACLVARAEGARRVVLAVPVAPPGWEQRFGGVADECVALSTPAGFVAVGQAYEDFGQTTDDEVVACLERAGGPA
jgi:putative phosphoribosyl transferase